VQQIFQSADKVLLVAQLGAQADDGCAQLIVLFFDRVEAAGLNGAPRSDTNTNGDSRFSACSARISSPCNG
jgi:hypothetical protein